MQSSPFTPRRLFILVGRLLLAAIFIYAGYSKLFFPNRLFSSWFLIKFSVSSNLSNFGLQVAAYKLLSPAGVDFVAHTLPFAEVILGLLLLLGFGLRIWATAVTAVLVGFWVVVTRAYLLHMDINCGCFSTPEPLTLKTVIRDGILVAFAILMTVSACIEARKPHPWSTPQKA